VEDDEDNARAARITHEAAARLVRKETSALRRWAPRFADDPAGWTSWVTGFYGTYVADLERDLLLETVPARAYCAAHCDQLLTGGLAVTEAWDTDEAPRLAALALEG
jgi:hypothetical protein